MSSNDIEILLYIFGIVESCSATRSKHNQEVFTLPHIVWLDSTRLQVIFQSPPGVQVPFFFWWRHSQIMVPILPGIHLNSS